MLVDNLFAKAYGYSIALYGKTKKMRAVRTMFVVLGILTTSSAASAQNAEQFLRNTAGSVQTIYQSDPLSAMALCDIFANESNSPNAVVLRQTHSRLVQMTWDYLAFQYAQFGVRTFDDLKKFVLDNVEIGFQGELRGDQEFNSFMDMVKSEPRFTEFLIKACASSLVESGFNR